MSSRSIEIAVQKLAGTFKVDDLKCMFCTVQTVHEDTATCDVTGDNGILIPNVKLQASVCDGVLVLPAENSTVIIAMSKYNDPFVFMVSDITKFYLVAAGDSGTGQITVTNDGKIQLNDGSFGGLIQIEQLVTKINQLETKLTGLANYVGGLPVPVSGSVSAAPVTAAVADFVIIQQTSKTDLENSSITHGQ